MIRGSTRCRSVTVRLLAVQALLVGVIMLTAVPRAAAHQFPSGCQGSGINLRLFVRFGDNTTDATGASFSPCETVNYHAQLCYSGGNTCAIEGDASTTWTIHTPDGAAHNVK